MNDLIDRDALLLKQKAHADLFIDSTMHDDIVRRDEATAALAEIINAPSVNRWIPCSERLPEDNAEVLVSFARRYVKIGYIEPGDGLRYWVIPGHSVVPLNYIEAWMQMPDAYKPPKE